MKIQASELGKSKEGKTISCFTLRNGNGLEIRVTDYGAILLGVIAPDAAGNFKEITLNFDSIEGYFQRHPYFGATVGRFCNRIGKAAFTLDGSVYNLVENDGRNHLHGGVVGFDRRMWSPSTIESTDSAKVDFRYLSPAGEEGYPGNLEVLCSYALNENNEIVMEYEAVTDAPTPINLTNHAYWNLGGAGSGNVLNHELQINADLYLETDRELIPTGKLLPVAGSPRDFREKRKIADGKDFVLPLDMSGKPGYDHCFVIRKEKAGLLVRAAEISDPVSGRLIQVDTTQPAIQLYTGNSLDGSVSCNGFKQHAGFCLETQHYPDSPNHPEFPSTILVPGEKFRHKTVYRILSGF
jgi:aldose 1-epimerase